MTLYKLTAPDGSHSGGVRHRRSTPEGLDAACEFGPPHEPFGCRVHFGVRTTLDQDHCNRFGPRRDDRAIDALVDAAIRRGDITESRGAEMLGLRIREWRQRVVRLTAASPEAEK